MKIIVAHMIGLFSVAHEQRAMNSNGQLLNAEQYHMSDEWIYVSIE